MSKLLLFLKNKQKINEEMMPRDIINEEMMPRDIINEEIDYIPEKGTFLYNIKPYCIYFPQFHSIPENDVNFYPGMTDITNLNELINLTKEELETPSTKSLPLKNMLDYDLVNNNELIQRQIDIISDYNIGGFAIYYYWFSENSITKKNMIFEKVINQFFDNKINMKGRKVFFLWANESWTNNTFFGNTNSINNTYEKEFFINNADNLMNYFKHDNYLKIDNKPVFFIHQPAYINDTELNNFIEILNNKCIENNFDGIYLSLNAVNNRRKDFNHYNMHPNYKNFNKKDIFDGQSCINYEKYTDNLKVYNNYDINCLFFDFNSRARLFKPDRLNLSHKTINKSEEYYINFINKTVKTYKNRKDQGLNKILLINAWNELGERMCVEPSEQKGFYYLDLIKKHLYND